MTGRLSMEAAKRIKEKREFEDELQSIGVHKDEDHVEETRRRSSTSAGKIRTRKSKELSSDDSAEDEDEDADVKPVKRVSLQGFEIDDLVSSPDYHVASSCRPSPNSAPHWLLSLLS